MNGQQGVWLCCVTAQDDAPIQTDCHLTLGCTVMWQEAAERCTDDTGWSFYNMHSFASVKET